MVPPTLAWLDGVCHSLAGALDSSVSYSVEKTVNPLLFKVRLTFSQPVQGKNMMLIWNLFQKYASRNDCIPQGKTESSDRELLIAVGTKQRLGQPRTDHPLE